MSVMKSVDMKNTRIHEEPLNHYDASIRKKINNSAGTKMLVAIVERTFFAIQCFVGFAAVICVHSCKNTK